MSLATVHITGIGGYLPERVLTNADLEKMIDTTDVWIRERTGIEQRHIIAEDQMTSDLAAAAAMQALDDAGITINDIDALVVATTTPDMIFPSTATVVQSKLGGKDFPAWDIQAVCSGFVYGLAQVDGMMRSGMFKRVLLIGAEAMSRIVNWQDRGTCILFGDGAGAVVLEARDASVDYGMVGSVLHADGSYRDLLKAHHPHPPSSPEMHHGAADFALDSAGAAAVEMKGNEVFRVAVTKLGSVVNEILEKYELVDSDIDWLVPHQANIRIIQATAKKLKMDMDRVALTVARHGNTSSASVPLALNDLYRTGRLETGQLILLEAFAGGFAWGANLLRWSK
ncbi:beta-ketoacyl-ACP synthase III [Mariprofundus ferrooxydans]|uniref:Beta-ketoacyl-[acyl-carrier-protein] synthase III n=1 Tax=Mariprofundus ferrooxydans PV-1 TaxID=314345 RepID=Q0F0G2_9PROT|nr:beta-ketoacyl-ACP synthase III [Mariprofundus ferrooxydans]EAU55066.1 3-oxoacyl-(acyl-carrier-protein) synthase III [Mariprofundus ferrooxydans PV-1]KON46891.1 3-oxoacyl-ACP synthase [Mariprofundus ferrooxydans]